jgi:hypothetical protein
MDHGKDAYEQIAARTNILRWVSSFHGVNTGSNPVGDAKSFNNLRALRFSRGTVISREKRDWWVNPRL